MRILVQRFSALGDIVILLPILQQVKLDYPNAEIALVSRNFIRPLAEGIGLQFYAADLNGRHKGFVGLNRLAREINKDFNPDLVIDAHSVLRSKLVSFSFKLMAKKVYSLQKDRSGRKQLLATKDFENHSLSRMYQLHLNTFLKAGLNVNFDPNKIHTAPFSLEQDTRDWWLSEKRKLNIGIAPGAKHKSKQWPGENFASFMNKEQSENTRFFLFGGPEEIDLLRGIGEQSNSDYRILAGRYSLAQEIALMKEMDLIISHDSSNMHLAAWSGTPVISIWGGTHPAAGFAPYANEQNILAVPEGSLDCRPCSIYGTSTCTRGDWACMKNIKVKDLQAKSRSIL